MELEDNNYTYNEVYDNNCPVMEISVVHFVLQAAYLLVCIVGLLGNTLVIYVVLRYSKMQTVTNMYIVNLAIADECFLIGIPVLIAKMSLNSWSFGSFICKAYMVSAGINQFTSSIFLCIMSADRYIAVCHPISAPRLRTPFVSRVVSAAAWTASALVMTPIFMYTTLIPNENGVSCNIMWPEQDWNTGQKAFTLYSFALGFAIPLAMIFVFYCLVIKKLQNVGPKNKPKEKKRPHRKVTRLVLTVIAVYMLCWLPYWVFQVTLIYSTSNQCASQGIVIASLATAFLSYSNSAMNPILYAFMSDNFKKSFLKACTCVAGKNVNGTLHIDKLVFPKKKRGVVLQEQGQALMGGQGKEDLTASSAALSEAVPLDARLTSLAPLLPPTNGVTHTKL